MLVKFLLKYGELTLKGKNRSIFEDRLINNAKTALKKYKTRVYKPYGRFFLEVEVASQEEITEIKHILQQKVFGLHSVALGLSVRSDINVISETSLKMVKEYLKENPQKKTFKIETKRPYKKFPMQSPEVSMQVGGDIFEAIEELGVKMKNPDFVLHVEIISDETYIYIEKERCQRGLPVGSSGRVGLLLSGGLDSPVAGWLSQKRGCILEAIYFHSPPYTTEKAKQKVKDLAKVLSTYQNKLKLHIVHFTEIQLMMKSCIRMEYFVILGRRMMVRIANQIAEDSRLEALVTGENLGQVASQTIQNLHCVNTIAELPILRPLIAFDKDDTMDIARKIGTYDISILPYDDCCSLFLPPDPSTKSKIKYLELEEKKFPVEELVKNSIAKSETILFENGEEVSYEHKL